MINTITNRDTYLFTCGSCHRLAETISDITGWQICSFWDEVYDDYEDHAFVRTPKGTYLDVKGVFTKDEMINEWYGKPIVEVHDFSRLEDWCPDMDDEGMQRSREIAEAVLRMYYRRIPKRIKERL